MTQMPIMGWPNDLPPGTRFTREGKRMRFVSTVHLVFHGERPMYEGTAIWSDGPDKPTRRIVPAELVEVKDPDV